MKIKARTGKIIAGFVEILADEKKDKIEKDQFLGFYSEAQLVRKTGVIFAGIYDKLPAYFIYSIHQQSAKSLEKAENLLYNLKAPTKEKIKFMDWSRAFPPDEKIIILQRKYKPGSGNNIELRYALANKGKILISNIDKLIFDYYENLPITYRVNH